MRKTLPRYAWWKEIGVGLFMLPLIVVAYAAYYTFWFPPKAVRRLGRWCLANWSVDEEARRWGQGGQRVEAPYDFICRYCGTRVPSGTIVRRVRGMRCCIGCGPRED